MEPTEQVLELWQQADAVCFDGERGGETKSWLSTGEASRTTHASPIAPACTTTQQAGNSGRVG